MGNLPHQLGGLPRSSIGVPPIFRSFTVLGKFFVVLGSVHFL